MNSEDLLADGALTVANAVKEFGIGRTKLYQLMESGRLAYSQLDGRRLIPRRALKRLLAGQLVGAAGSAADAAASHYLR